MSNYFFLFLSIKILNKLKFTVLDSRLYTFVVILVSTCLYHPWEYLLYFTYQSASCCKLLQVKFWRFQLRFKHFPLKDCLYKSDRTFIASYCKLNSCPVRNIFHISSTHPIRINWIRPNGKCTFWWNDFITTAPIIWFSYRMDLLSTFINKYWIELIYTIRS
jgi:hypothetical protein